VAPELLELEELLVAAAVAELVELVGSTVLLELEGVIAAAVSWRIAGAMVEVGAGVEVEVEVLEDEQAAATAVSSHSNLWSARPWQASLMLMASGALDLEGSNTTKLYSTGPVLTVSVSVARLWW
jgi:hypothetical protein